MTRLLATLTLVVFASACGVEADPTTPAGSTAQASGGTSSGGGSGGGGIAGVDTIKVGKHDYVAANGTILVSASSTDGSAHLYVSTQAGRYLGEIPNGSPGRYGGAVFYVGADPLALTIDSSSGGTVTVPTVPFQL